MFQEKKIKIKEHFKMFHDEKASVVIQTGNYTSLNETSLTENLHLAFKVVPESKFIP